MSYYTEMQKQKTIAQFALGLVIGSAFALLVFIIKLIRTDAYQFGDIGWNVAYLLVAAVGVMLGAWIMQSSISKAETVRIMGGHRRAA